MDSNIGIGIWEYSVAIPSFSEEINVKSCACFAITVLNKITNALHKLLHYDLSNGAKGPVSGPLFIYLFNYLYNIEKYLLLVARIS